MAKRWLVGLLATAVLVGSATLACAGVGKITTAEVEALVAKTPAEGNYLIIDSRPELKYLEGHIPGAISLAWQEMADRADELPADKKTKLVFYCGGVKCDLSAKAADFAEKKGYKNVFVYVEGEPAWRASGHDIWVGTGYVKLLLNDRERVAMLVDARPQIKYFEGTVPGAISLPFQEWDKRVGLLPADKNTQLIFFCGGLKCDLSMKAAVKARALGYTDVRIYAEGWPAWQKGSTRAFAMINPQDPGAAVVAAEAAPVTGEIGKDEFLKLVAEKPAGFLLVDVRPAADFKAGHIPGSISIPDEEISKNIELLKKSSNVVFICATGARSAGAFYAAEDAGLKGTRFLNRNLDVNPDGTFTVK